MRHPPASCSHLFVVVLMPSLSSVPGVESGDIEAASQTWALVRSSGPGDSGSCQPAPGLLRVVLVPAPLPAFCTQVLGRLLLQRILLLKQNLKAAALVCLPLFNS